MCFRSGLIKCLKLKKEKKKEKKGLWLWGVLFIPVSLQRFMTAGRGKDFCPRRRLVPPWWTSGQWDNTRCGLTFSTTTTTTSEITSETIALQRKKERNNEITKKMSKTFVASTNLSEFYFSFSFFLSISFFCGLRAFGTVTAAAAGPRADSINSGRRQLTDEVSPPPAAVFCLLLPLCSLLSPHSLAQKRKKERKKPIDKGGLLPSQHFDRSVASHHTLH